MALNSTMDYGSLLQLAKKTSDMKKQAKRSGPSSTPVRTSIEHQKAEMEKKKLLDANVARFLAKREAEERKRKLEANERREGLLAIRNKDSKARKRVKIMNKSAKSADKSAIEDAVGPSDYYVIEEPLCFMSQESLVQEEKFIEKLCKVPTEEIFSKKKANLNKDLSGTKDRVKMALLLGDTVEKKEKREAKEKLKEQNLKEKGRSDKKVEIEEPREEEKPKKPRQPKPPPMNYHELLKLAEKLQQEPVREAPKEKEPELRPMTTKERELYLLEEASRRRKEEGWKAPKKKTDRVSSSLQSSKPSLPVLKEEKGIPSIPRIPKIGDSRLPAQERKSDSYEERKSKSSREEKCVPSNQRPSHRPEEKTSGAYKPSRQAESPTPAKQSHSQDRNHNDRNTQRKDERNDQRKSQGTRGEQERSATRRPAPSQPQGKPSSMSRDEAKPNSKKPLESSNNSRNSTLSEKAKSQPKPTAPSNREHQSDTHVPRKPLASDLKSRNNFHTSKPKPMPPDVKPKHTELKSRPLSSQDSKSKPHVAVPVVKSRSLTPSDSKPKHLFDVKARQPPPNSKPKQQTASDTRHPPVSKSSKPETSSPNVKSRDFPPSDVKRKFPPPSSVGPKLFPPADVRRKQFPPADVRRGPKPQAKKRRVIDSDEEYDSEVADFIDDGPDVGGEDYSKHIREIFGYDRTRYRDSDRDDECMESSFSQQMKEEFKSTKLGIMEDLEDIRREKQREAMLKKKRRLK